jgi:predicted permease
MHLLSDLRIGARLLAKDRWFTLAAVLTLALGIAATNTVFTIVNATLFRAMPFEEPDRLVDLGEVSYPDLQDWRTQARTFEGLAATDERPASVADDANAAERVIGGYVSANTFALVRQRPLLGRDFQAADERPGAPAVVMLGHRVWSSRYQSDPAIVGRTIRINGVPSTVIGVMPEGFAFPQIAQLWLPVAGLRPETLTDREANPFTGFGRLRSGTTYEQARAELVAIAARLDRQYPRTRDRQVGVTVFRSGIDADTPASVAFTFMLGAVIFVLLIACANVANLLLARSASRTREISLRLSLGATRSQIVRQLLVENSLLAAVAGTVALGLSQLGLTAMWQVIMQSGQMPPYWLNFQMDARVFAFLLIACLSTAMLSGLAPAWVTSKANLVEVLAGGTRGAIGTRFGRRWTSAFVVGQLALAIVLLSGAGLMLRSLLDQVTTQAGAGVDLSGLVTARLDLPDGRYQTPEQRQAFYRQLDERLSAPGVRVSYATEVPLAGGPLRPLVTDRRPDATGELPSVGQMMVGAHYFETLGVPVRGRMIRSDEPDAARLAIVNERLAEMYFPGEDAIGHRVRFVRPVNPPTATEWMTIVGIVPNVRQRSNDGGAFDPLVYVTVDGNPPTGTNLIARSALDVDAVASVLRQTTAAIDPDLPVSSIVTVGERLVEERWAQRFTSTLFSIIAGIALLLGTVGLYAVTAYAASQRTKELGLRLALGALARDVWWTVVERAVKQVAVGLTLGIAGGVAVSRILPAQLTGAVGTDPLTFAAVAAVLVIAALVASSLPARRAMRLDPVAALRAD